MSVALYKVEVKAIRHRCYTSVCDLSIPCMAGYIVKLLQRSLMTVGWISRKHFDSRRGRAFFLTSLLIELIERSFWTAGGVAGLVEKPRLIHIKSLGGTFGRCRYD